MKKLGILSLVIALFVGCASTQVERVRWWTRSDSPKFFEAWTEDRWPVVWDSNEKEVSATWWMNGATLRVTKGDVIKIVLPTNFRLNLRWYFLTNFSWLQSHPDLLVISNHEGVLDWWSMTEWMPVCNTCYNSQYYKFYASKPGKANLTFVETNTERGYITDTYRLTVLVYDE